MNSHSKKENYKKIERKEKKILFLEEELKVQSVQGLGAKGEQTWVAASLLHWCL